MLTGTPRGDMEMTRVFGKCPVKGCRKRAVLDVPAFREPIRDGLQRTIGTRLVPVVKHPAIPDGGWSTIHDFTRPYFKLNLTEGVQDDRPRCPDHRNLMAGWQVINGTDNPDKTCDGRCRSATGPNCECSCRGEQHGADVLIR